MVFLTAFVLTCCSLSIQRCAHAPGVLSHHVHIVGGSRLQVVQSVGGHVTHKEVYWLFCASWKATPHGLKEKKVQDRIV